MLRLLDELDDFARTHPVICGAAIGVAAFLLFFAPVIKWEGHDAP